VANATYFIILVSTKLYNIRQMRISRKQ